ncbi:MAG: hypothetical protein WBQ87_10610 [Candidatus Sulfotelmatobacter sp.]
MRRTKNVISSSLALTPSATLWMRQNEFGALADRSAGESNQKSEAGCCIQVSRGKWWMHGGAPPMEHDAQTRARIAALDKEINAIYFADRRYWKQGEDATHEERIEHQRRQERLEQIRKELCQLRSA